MTYCLVARALSAASLMLLLVAVAAACDGNLLGMERSRPAVKDMVPWDQAGLISTARSPYCRLAPVPIRAVKVQDGFWKRWMDANRTRGIPALLKQLEDHGVVDNFRLVSGRKSGERKGPYFTDSDLFKWMEGAALALQSDDDPKLRKALDEVIDDVVAAQREDGYLNTFFTGPIADQRFRNLPVEHELYCAGHMFQAAVAHHRATGDAKFLDAAIRYADFLVEQFGPGKIEQADGHAEVEMALVELYRATGRRSCLDLAAFLLKLQNFPGLQKITGHAVRAEYLCCGGADLFAETGDAPARDSLDHLWRDMVSGKVYITGGTGSRYSGEAFGEPYELPNERAYAETCAAIANGMWSFRMLGLSGDAQHADMMERVLYNGFLSGVSLETDKWFYVNPLACWWDYQRQPWFGCTCCPTNAVRAIAAIPGCMYGVNKEGVWVHLYQNSRVDWHLPDGGRFTLSQKTRYPWDGAVEIAIDPESASDFSIFLRIPGWCRKASARVNGKKIEGAKPGTYLEIRRTWKRGDVVSLDLPMPVEMIESDPRVRENLCSVALQRGPVVYCFESVDNPGVELRDMELPEDPRFDAALAPDLLNGVVTIKSRALAPSGCADRGPLYRVAGSLKPAKKKEVEVTAIPYYAWANRGPSRMTIWVPRLPKASSR